MNKNLDLFLTFMKIGAFTFGGGYAMIPLIQREVCENKKWLDEKEIADIVAISESTPGPIAINAATFVGYRTNGFPGACIATLGVVLPSFLIISLISFILNEFQNFKPVRYAFTGIRAAVLALILKALFMMFKKTHLIHTHGSCAYPHGVREDRRCVRNYRMRAVRADMVAHSQKGAEK